MRSKRNKTIDFTLEEASPELLNQIIQPTDNLQTISNKIINGDSFKVMTQLAPHQVDPPQVQEAPPTQEKCSQAYGNTQRTGKTKCPIYPGLG